MDSGETLVREEDREMTETYQCPVEGCDHVPFKSPQALQSHIRNIHPGFLKEKGPAREVPIVEEDFTTAELVRGKRMDIEQVVSYGVCDKSALR